jgi:XTP/dITP diphosphohydrolase
MDTDLTRLVLATRNPGKLRELQRMLSTAQVHVLGLADVPNAPPDVEETGATFADNAALKAIGYGAPALLPTLADDSGLEVDALLGAPGVYSARYADREGFERHEGEPHDAANNRLLLERMAQVPDPQRAARFRCVLALWVPPGPLETKLARAALSHPNISALPASAVVEGALGSLFFASGSVEGYVLREPAGVEGFGYDPLFLSAELGVSFGLATHDQKALVSHRARALRSMVSWLTSA